MRRHLIVGRFGHHDRTRIPASQDEVVTRLDLVASQSRLDYGIGHALEDLARLNVFPSEIGSDLLVLAAHVHAADTRISRTTESQDTWTREIRLVVPVSDLTRWSSTVSILKRMLDFLTGDYWTIGFRSRPPRFATPNPDRSGEQFEPPFDSLALFSGGLDSLIGAIDLLECGGKPLLVSHVGDAATSNAQRTCLQRLKDHYGRDSFGNLRLWMTFPKSLVRDSGPEDTTRGRSFLFFSIGVFAGTGLGGAFVLRAPENGLIAINVPLDPLRLGSNSTRTTHPFYIALWNELLEHLSIDGRVENPYWDRTKGEMVTACANRTLLGDLIATSLSCSSPTKGRFRGRGIEHCGYCLPCLIRRAAIERALGHGADPTLYTLSDLGARALDTGRAEGQQVRSFQFAIERLTARPELAKFLIHKPGPLSNESAERLEALADVYRRGMEEVAALLAGVRTSP